MLFIWADKIHSKDANLLQLNHKFLILVISRSFKKVLVAENETRNVVGLGIKLVLRIIQHSGYSEVG